MGNLRKGHLVEAGLWLGLCLFLYVFSFDFERPIEIYKFGASAWPRAIILLMAIAALGQLYHQWKYGDEASTSLIGTAVDEDEDAEEAAHEAHHENAKWYFSTLGLLSIPFIYMRLPDWIAAGIGADKTGLHITRIVVAAILIAIVVYFIRHHRVRVALMFPLFFAALLEDFGFYSLAPFFIVGVMYLFGERRARHMAVITAFIYGLVLLLFVSVLFVGLPIGNIRPFYDIGSWIVTVLQ